MRSIELLKGFTQKELSEIEIVLSQKKRQSLFNLFVALKAYIRRTKLPERKELFEKTFNKPYTAKNNDKLNKELFLLNEVLYEQLAMMAFRSKIRKNESTLKRWIGEGLYDRNMEETFKQEIDTYIKLCKTDIIPENTARLMHLKSRFNLRRQEKTMKNLNEHLEEIYDLMKEDLRHYRYRLRKTEAQEAILVKELGKTGMIPKAPDGSVKEASLTESISLAVDENDWYEEFLILTKLNYMVRGPERLQLLERLKELGEYDQYETEYTVVFRVNLSQNYTRELISLERYEEADEEMKQMLAFCENRNLPLPAYLILNLVANKINYARFQEGIDTYARYQDKLEKLPTYNIATLSVVYCHLFLNEPDEAIAILPASKSLSYHEKYMKRVAYIIAFCLREQYEMAYNEAYNFKRTITNDSSIYSDIHRYIGNWFYQYTKRLYEHQEMQSLTDKIV